MGESRRDRPGRQERRTAGGSLCYEGSLLAPIAFTVEIPRLVVGAG